eukprot:RCo047421
MAVPVGVSQSSNVVTCIRLRPLLGKESRNIQYSVVDNTAIHIVKPSESVTTDVAERRSYEFSQIWDTDATQEDIHGYFWPNVENNLFNGFNATIMCYGQTGAGKTFTLCDNGLLTRLCGAVFQKIQREPGAQYECSVSFIEIYQEAVYDLISSECDKRRSHGGGAPTGANKMNFFEGEKHLRLPVSSVEDVASAFEMGNRFRRTASHDLNSRSSRSHSLFYLHICKRARGKEIWHSKLTIVDLAGSERVSKTHSTGEVFREAVAINQSLSALLDVVKALASRKKLVVFRQNLLTLYLKDSLLNSYFALICCCSVAAPSLDETLCTLSFGSIAKTVQITRVRNVLRSPQKRATNEGPLEGPTGPTEPPQTVTISVHEYEELRAQLLQHKDEAQRREE